MADRDIPADLVEKGTQALLHDNGSVHQVRVTDPVVARWMSEQVLGAALTGYTLLDTAAAEKLETYDPGALNTIASAVTDLYGYVPLTVRYQAAAAALRVVNEWNATTPVTLNHATPGDPT